MKQIHIFLLLLASMLLGVVLSAQQDVTLTLSADNSIFSENDNSNGAGEHIFVGRTSNANRRGLIKFDFSELPAGDITNVELKFTGTRGGPNNVDIHRLTADWGEGTSDAGSPGGTGASPTDNDATWNFSFFNTTSWATAGGDFEGESSASFEIGNGANASVSNDNLLADVQSMIENPEMNFGWLLIGEETVSRSAVRIAGKTASSGGVELVVTIAETASCDISGGSIVGADGASSYSICAGDAMVDMIDVTLEGNTGTNSGWVITDLDQNILGLPASPPFNLEGAGGGSCLIWHISTEDDFRGAAIGANVSDLAGCFNLSNSIQVDREGVNGGEIAINGGGTEIAICAGDGN